MMKNIILIVDDNQSIRFSIKIGLEELEDSYEVIEIENGEKCIEYLDNHYPPDLILLDIMMPGMDGWSVASKIKSNPNWNKIPIFFLTAKKDVYSSSFGKMLSEKYICKPFEMNELITSIKQVLG
jgi:DNA-binding response OmpR family regulator